MRTALTDELLIRSEKSSWRSSFVCRFCELSCGLERSLGPQLTAPPSRPGDAMLGVRLDLLTQHQALLLAARTAHIQCLPAHLQTATLARNIGPTATCRKVS